MLMASVLVKIMAGQRANNSMYVISYLDMQVIAIEANGPAEQLAICNELQLPLRRLGLCCLLAQILVMEK